jgi:hypothetical protein
MENEQRTNGLDAARGVVYGLAFVLPFWLVVCVLVVGLMEWLK